MRQRINRLFIQIFSFGFKLLYHDFVWIYPFAAWLVSAGLWNKWIEETLLLANPGLILDIGCGRGILLEKAKKSNCTAFGLDESPQMLLESRRRNGGENFLLIRGIGQNLPFVKGFLPTITATFPAPYIFEETTLNEIHRVLSHGGKFIILLTAIPTGTNLHHILIRFAGRFFGFAGIQEDVIAKIQQHIGEFNFKVSREIRQFENSKMYFIVAQPF